MPIDFQLDHTKSTVLGFSNAGWQALQTKLSQEGVTLYTTTSGVLDRERSIYWRHHESEVLKKKSATKVKEPESVVAALGMVGSVFIQIKEEKTRENFLRYFVKDIYRESDETLRAYLSEVLTAEQKRGNMAQL